MTTPMRPSPRHVPTLTEVIDLPEVQVAQVDAGDAVVTDLPSSEVPEPVPPAVAEPVFEPAAEPVAVAMVQAAAPADVPLNLQDAPIPRAMLVDRGTESPSFSRTVPGGLPAASGNLGASASTAVPIAGAGLTGAALEAQITQRVMADLQRQIDGMLEYRLRETLAPILARTSEALVRELRQELSKTMKDVVARSVAQEVARQRSRG
jgi:hypothetical protein